MATPAVAGPGVRAAWPAVNVVEDPIVDDRDAIQDGETTLLIVEDDPHYARILLGLARARGFRGIVTNRGAAALSLAKEFRPTAITLDVFLPDMLGWTVLNSLKFDPATRHIPVQMLSVEEERQHGLSHGAFSYLVKPATTVDIEMALDRIKAYVAAAHAPPAGRRGQRHRAREHRRFDRP